LSSSTAYHDGALGRAPLANAARLPKVLDVLNRAAARGAFVGKVGPKSIVDVHWPENDVKVVARHGPVPPGLPANGTRGQAFQLGGTWLRAC
jgi:hypothetical protein